MRSRHIWLETMQQILTTSIECKLDVNQLLQYRLYQNDPINNNAKIDSPDVHRLKQFSIRGTLALLAYAIVTQQFSHTTICGCNDVQLNSLNLAGAPWIPCITTPRWLFAHMIYFAHQGTEGFSGQGDTTEETTADLALAALLPLLTLLGTDAFDSRHCERRICIQPTTLVQLVQTLATIASLSPHAQIRFVAYRTLAMTVTIAGITGEVRMLCNLLGHCPFPTMRAATVGLIREAVHRNMSITSMDNPFNSLQFWSVFGRLLFLPHGNILPSTILDCSSATWQQDRFMEYTDFIMHVLNFYIYLLLRDRVTQRLGVWKEEACQQVREQLLHPTRRCLEIILASSCKASTQHDATEYTPILSTLANALDRIDEIIS
ncbi:hypothetical protein BDF22DRAFT_232734 [Syncephalis plumigaleata]|nr:hypothetical protein BDF22DRAFT_232734 [Syncephalis plumigaleata]